MKIARFVCVMIAGAAALPSMAQDPRAGPARLAHVPLMTACPDALNELPDNLYPAWRALDSAAVVLVDFKVDGGRISQVNMSGGHGDYVGPVRRAVKTIKCGPAGGGSYAVRFSIKFQYPEDQGSVATAMQLLDGAAGR
jgi:hypothetical protein